MPNLCRECRKGARVISIAQLEGVQGGSDDGIRGKEVRVETVLERTEGDAETGGSRTSGIIRSSRRSSRRRRRRRASPMSAWEVPSREARRQTLPSDGPSKREQRWKRGGRIWPSTASETTRQSSPYSRTRDGRSFYESFSRAATSCRKYNFLHKFARRGCCV